MNCHRVQNLLSAYIDRELDLDEQRALRNHLYQCPNCEKEYRSLVLVKQAMGGLYPPSPPADSVALFKQQLAGTMTCIYTKHSPFFLWRHAAMTAACFGLFFATSLWLFPKNNLPINGSMASDSRPIQSLSAVEPLPSPTKLAAKEKVAVKPQPTAKPGDDREKDDLNNNMNNINWGPTLIGIPVSQ
ncbi:MAG TPA: hypothetical protein GX391_09100 [Firmicutes bacterium]|jgi:hypothetical protein|nr:hypothetical protein [Bacillota bacterium]HOQ24917.1 zf-HC2 domain-containing protein [Bacillota bacterium]HPT68310.1 zf-HC2 domain-containing protein [Bacillota bacterium]